MSWAEDTLEREFERSLMNEGGYFTAMQVGEAGRICLHCGNKFRPHHKVDEVYSEEHGWFMKHVQCRSNQDS